MMRLVRRASLLVAFYMLASAATAYAECAWVLWAVYGDGSGGIKLLRETLKECREELSREAAEQIKVLTFAGFKAPQFQESDETHKVMIKSDPVSLDTVWTTMTAVKEAGYEGQGAKAHDNSWQ